jgi:hypothetical protein
MNENQVALINEAIRLIQRRAVDPRRTVSQRMSYNSALTMLLYAINENAECLAQFDDVKLCCEECARFGSDRMQDVQFCNACEKEEFFECGR